MIVDEEQHFGVKHKEKLKELRADVHMLTLTATPIPRTLQMALSRHPRDVDHRHAAGRPPGGAHLRHAVRPGRRSARPCCARSTAAARPITSRPRISDLPELERFLREQVPEVKFVVGHGQMAPTQLEEVMSAFYDGQYDVLLSTTIVESGLDIPTANTMIIHRADMFGLAQLYQLRGRVGRAKARAYAYLTTPAEKQITLSAEKRLKVLQSLDSLGAGFQLASHDLDIRGGGNLLGDEQSGHIREIGVELYQQMLEDAVDELTRTAGAEEVADRGWSPQINTGAAVLIPEDYVPDLNVRLALYRRLSDAEKAAGPRSPGRRADRPLRPAAAGGRPAAQGGGDQGPVPRGQRRQDRRRAEGRGGQLPRRRLQEPRAAWSASSQKNQVAWRIRPDNKVVVKGEWETPKQRLDAAEKVLSELAKLAA